MCDEEMTGTGPVYGPTGRARKLYYEFTANDPKIHCNRFPTWDELTDAERDEWRKKAG